MEATRFQNIAMDYQKKWLTATGLLQEQRKEIDALKGEITRLQRKVYLAGVPPVLSPERLTGHHS